MKPKLGQLRKAICNSKCFPGEGLEENIWCAVVACNERRANFKLVLFSFIALLSLAGLIPVIEMLSSDFVQSGFYEYLSLAFSTGLGSFTTYFQEFAFSLAESLPLLSITLSLLLLFIFFLSMRYAMKQIIRDKLTLSL